MDTNLFAALKKHRPRANKDSVENFLTETFAWVLKNDNLFAKYFLSKVLSDFEANQLKDLELSWETQAYFAGVYPDMICKYADDKVLVFEHKAWAYLHENQLDRYREYAKFNFSEYKIILITAHSAQHQQNFDIALCWSDVYLHIDEWLKNHKENQFLLECFQNLIKHEGMAPSNAISHSAILYYPFSKHIKRDILALTQKVLAVPANTEEIAKIVGTDFKFAVQSDWGRIGICGERTNTNNTLGWNPGIFMGFMLDGHDHRLTDDVVYAVVIISFNQNLHKLYPTNPNYLQMVADLQEETNKVGDGWEFYHHIKDETLEKHNFWHPVYIRKPLIELFRGTSNINEQYTIYWETIRNFLSVIWSMKSFQAIRKDYE